MNRPDREKVARMAFQFAFLIDDKDIDRRWLDHKDKHRWYDLADQILARIEWCTEIAKTMVTEAKKQTIRQTVNYLKMRYCIMAPEARIKEIEEHILEEKK